MGVLEFLEVGGDMDALRTYALLQEACKELEVVGEHAIAAHVSYAMALVTERFGVGSDHRAEPEDA